LLPDALGEAADAEIPWLPSSAVSAAPRMSTLDELERQAIVDTLAAVGGNKAEAARRLGISEKSIYNKMKRFGLS